MKSGGAWTTGANNRSSGTERGSPWAASLLSVDDSVAQDGHVVGLKTFVCFHNIEANQLTLAQNPATAAADCTKVYENLVATIAHNKAKAFLHVEPLDGAFFIASGLLSS